MSGLQCHIDWTIVRLNTILHAFLEIFKVIANVKWTDLKGLIGNLKGEISANGDDEEDIEFPETGMEFGTLKVTFTGLPSGKPIWQILYPHETTSNSWNRSFSFALAALCIGYDSLRHRAVDSCAK